MKSYIEDGAKKTPVKNLGWVLRNWELVKEVEIAPSLDPWGCVFRAILKDGRTYISDFASLAVCVRWLDRPVFRGLHIKIGYFPDAKPYAMSGHGAIIGSEGYRSYFKSRGYWA